MGDLLQHYSKEVTQLTGDELDDWLADDDNGLAVYQRFPPHIRTLCQRLAAAMEAEDPDDLMDLIRRELLKETGE